MVLQLHSYNLLKGYAIISNGGYDITPTLIKDKNTSYAKKESFK